MQNFGEGWRELRAAARDKKEENSNLLHERFPKLGLLYGSFGVLCPRGRYVYIGRQTLHLHVN
jgi:hypothetical protein